MTGPNSYSSTSRIVRSGSPSGLWITYGENAPGGTRAANRTGWGHIALGVSDVAGARVAVLEAGGESVGEVVTLQTADGRRVTWCYVTDPEGNIIELQSWD